MTPSTTSSVFNETNDNEYGDDFNINEWGSGEAPDVTNATGMEVNCVEQNVHGRILLSGCRYENNFVWGGVLEGAPAVDNTSLPEGDALSCLIFCAETTTYFVLTPPNPHGKNWNNLDDYPDSYDAIDFKWWCWCTNEDSPKTELYESFSATTSCVPGTAPRQNNLY